MTSLLHFLTLDYAFIRYRFTHIYDVITLKGATVTSQPGRLLSVVLKSHRSGVRIEANVRRDKTEMKRLLAKRVPLRAE